VREREEGGREGGRESERGREVSLIEREREGGELERERGDSKSDQREGERVYPRKCEKERDRTTEAGRGRRNFRGCCYTALFTYISYVYIIRPSETASAPAAPPCH
jgi:hypothetical protein